MAHPLYRMWAIHLDILVFWHEPCQIDDSMLRDTLLLKMSSRVEIDFLPQIQLLLWETSYPIKSVPVPPPSRHRPHDGTDISVRMQNSHWFIHSFNNCIQITVWGAEDTVVNNTVKVPDLMELLSMISDSILLWKNNIKQGNFLKKDYFGLDSQRKPLPRLSYLSNHV